MKPLIIGLFALGCALLGLGYASTQTGSSADERAGGALPIVIGGAVVVVDLIIAFVWFVFRA